MNDMHGNDDPNTPDTSGTGDRISDALNAYADTVQSADAWVGITERLEGRRSVWTMITQNPLTIGALAAATVLVAVVALSSLGAENGSETIPIADSVPVDDPPGQENNSPSTVPGTTPAPGENPDPVQPDSWRDVSGFAYMTPAGEIYQHSLAGAERRLLATLGSAEFGGGVYTAGMAITPDEETLFVSRWFIGGGGCEATLWSIDYPAVTEAPGATPVEVANGMYPAVSPDGAKLAYFTVSPLPDPGSDSGCIFDLVVEDLVTGDTTTWDGTPIFSGQAEWPSPVGLAWSPDNRTVAFSASYEGPTTYTFDTDTPTGELAAARLDISLPEAGRSWGVNAFLDTGELAVLASCDEGCLVATRTLLAVDPTDTSNFRYLASLPTTVRSVQVDRDGENILYTEFLCGASTECDSPLLWTDGTTEAVPAAVDVDVFTWVP